MKPFSRRKPRKPLSRTKARNAALINQFATPGLGSLMAQRWIAGIGQLLLAVTGFTMVVWWSLKTIYLYYSLLANQHSEPQITFGLVKKGAVLFVCAWLWALVTSLGILREGRENAAAEFEPARPPPLNSA